MGKAMINLFETPIERKKVRDEIYAEKYPNGCINIDGQKYFGFSMTGAIYQYRQKFPKYQKNDERLFV